MHVIYVSLQLTDGLLSHIRVTNPHKVEYYNKIEFVATDHPCQFQMECMRHSLAAAIASRGAPDSSDAAGMHPTQQGKVCAVVFPDAQRVQYTR
jgi:hypothetical protein